MIISILIGICLSLIALITSLGNIIVLLAFYCDNKLRTINDYFILNMAIADFLVGFFCIPFYIPSSIKQSWPFGRIFCKIWVTIDDVATMASVINIVAISVNRYWSIAYPLSYRKYVKQHFVYIVMGGVWCLSFINFAPGIWLLSLFSKESNISRNDCSGDYNDWFVYMLIAQFNYFIWPFVVLCVLNILLMFNIWKRSRKMIVSNKSIRIKAEIIKDTKPRLSITLEENINQTSSTKKSLNNCKPSITYFSRVIQDKSSTIDQTQKIRSSNKRLNGNSSPIVFSSRKCTSINYSTSRINRSDSLVEYQIDTDIEISRPTLNEIKRSTRKCQHTPSGQSRIARDRKAARSLFILVIVFLIFLFPYVICSTISTAGVNISPIIFEISFWLLWLNSTFNPFLYPFIQIKYRRAYYTLFQSCTKFVTFSKSNI